MSVRLGGQPQLLTSTPPSLWRQGLSHYLEHMLFMGSEPFPDENEFDSFLAANGGSSNACTENEGTTFYFDCRPLALRGALERFAGFFAAPLIKRDALEREVQAVDNEFTGVQQSDACRAAQLRAHTAKKGHPLAKFGWGDRRSLALQPAAAGLDVRQALVDYYRAEYSAERMTLVVVAGEALDTQEAWVREVFGGVPGGRGPPPSHAAAGWPFPADAPTLHALAGVRQGHHLQVGFQLPCLFAAYRSKAEEYLAHFVGHEGPGSLLSALKARGWASDLSGGVSEESTVCFLFDVTITLTGAGARNVARCAELLFGYLALLRERGPQREAWEEMARIAEMKFRFQEEEEVSGFATTLAGDMARYPPEHTLQGGYVYADFDADLIASLLEHLRPEAARLDLQTSLLPEALDTLRAEGFALTSGHEPWFDFDYVAAPIPDSLLARWKDAKPMSDMRLPSKNEFVPTDFSLRCEQADGETLDVSETPGNDVKQAPNGLLANGSSTHPSTTEPQDASPFATPPVLLVDRPGLRLWHKTDASFRLPRTTAHIRVSSPACYASARAAAATHLLLKLLEDALCETTYAAELAGLQCSCWFEGKAGLDFKVEGFSHRLHALAVAIFETLRALDPSPTAFARIHEGLRIEYSNMNLKPHKHATYLRLLGLKDGVWGPESILSELQSLDAAAALAFLHNDLLTPGALHLEALVHGNVTAEESEALTADVCVLLGEASSLPAAARPVERAVALPRGTRLLHRSPVRNAEEDNSVAEVYRQVGPDGVRARATLDLIEQVLQEPCYDTLRTKEQLGYSVHSGLRLTHGMLGFAVVVVSGERGPAHLEARIHAFLASQVDAIAGMREEEFAGHRAAVLAAKLLKHRSMVEEADAHWAAVTSRRYDFDARAREVEALESITRDEVLEFYKRHVAAPDRELSVHVVGRKHAAELEAPAPQGAVLVDDLATLHTLSPLGGAPAAELALAEPRAKRARCD